MNRAFVYENIASTLAQTFNIVINIAYNMRFSWLHKAFMTLQPFSWRIYQIQ